ALNSAGFTVGAISNIWHPYLESARRHFPSLLTLTAPLPPKLFSYLEGVAKPSSLLYEKALARCGVPAEQTVMVGDTYTADIAPAMGLGMKTIWVLHRPALERESLAKVAAGEVAPPSRTVTSIRSVTPQLISEVCAHQSIRVGESNEDQ